MKRVLENKVILLLLVVILLGYIIDFVALDVVINDTVWKQHLNEKYDKKYNEFKEFDLDLSEFEDELKEFEQQSEQENSYDWGSFYVDTLAIVVPLLVVIFGFSCIVLIFFLFHKTLTTIKYVIILKASTVAYVLFYIPDIVSNIYFLIFKRDYKMKDIQNFGGFFNTSSLFKKEQFSPWLWTAITDFQLIYILFPALVALGIKIMYKQFSMGLLLGYCYMAYLIAFVFYEIIMWYIFGF
jgi:hypothetical protein